jgi:2-polyprenyl-3-methyl-5-hydroxy-6-metoxy-1,4-benzoquinol methylase
MSAQGPDWTQFWKSERHAFDDVMRLATGYFADQFYKRFKPTSDTRLLDYGCGPGFLADELIPRGLVFSGADINSYFIDRCRANHPQANFFSIHADAKKNVDVLLENAKEPADLVILLSITQYLSSPHDLEEIIVSLRPHVKPSGYIIIADVVDEHTRSYRDALALLFYTIRKGKVGAFLRFMHYVLRSEYASIAQNNRLLFISENFIDGMCERQGYRCQTARGLTLHPTRTSYILQLKH